MDHNSIARRLEPRAADSGKLDIDSILHPAAAFAHPMDVVNDHDLTLNEKRAILASWASDACAIEAAPELRASACGKPVRWDDIMDALRLLDKAGGGAASVRRTSRKLRWRRWRQGSGGASTCGPQIF